MLGNETHLAISLFGVGHLSALLVLALWAVLLIRKCRKNTNSQSARTGVGILSFLCFASYPLNLLALEIAGIPSTVDNALPLHLCDLAAIICGFALLTRHPLLCELAYFWGLAGTLQGLLTPNLPYDLPHPVYFSFFLQHGVVVITALLLPLGLGWRPRTGGARYAFIWVILYAAIIYPVNLALQTNFAFLLEKPGEASLLDIMPAHPWYILWLIALAGVFFFLLSLPFMRSEKQ